MTANSDAPPPALGELARIDRLLHDAEHKDSAATFARNLMRQPDKAREFEQERDALITEANRLDPNHTAHAWAETTLEMPR